MKRLTALVLLALSISAHADWINIPFLGPNPDPNSPPYLLDTNRVILAPWWNTNSPWATNSWTNSASAPTNLELWVTNAGTGWSSYDYTNAINMGLLHTGSVLRVMAWQAWQAVDTNFYNMDQRLLNFEAKSNTLAPNAILVSSGTHWTNKNGYTVQVVSCGTGFNMGVNEFLMVTNVSSQTVIIQTNEWVSWTNGSVMAVWKPL